NSVAVKFDLYNNAGEGVNSTGLYLNGQAPTMPAVSMTGVNLHSGDVFNAHLAYDGVNLTMTLTDATTNASFTQTGPVDIPTAVGGTVAYVGFTGGTGGFTANQQILSWTYTSISASDFSIGVSPTVQTVAPGTNTTYGVTVTPGATFAGTVSF